jgi:uroporphyrin-III C-methyltransferase
VTHRGVANQVVICTGYGKEGTCPDLIRYHPEQTVVFLMAVGRLRELSQQLQRLAGYPSDMPVAIVERAACPNQRTIVGTLETIGDIAEQYQAQAPSTIVVGRVVKVLLDQDQTVITAETSPEARAALATAISAATQQQPSSLFLTESIRNCTAAFVN